MARTSDARSKNGSACCRSLSRMPSQACGRTLPRRAISYFATPASSAYPANPSWDAYLREIEIGVPSFGVQLLPIAVCPKGGREAAVRLTELEQNQDKLLPNLQARHIWLHVARACLGP